MVGLEKIHANGICDFDGGLIAGSFCKIIGGLQIPQNLFAIGGGVYFGISPAEFFKGLGISPKVEVGAGAVGGQGFEKSSQVSDSQSEGEGIEEFVVHRCGHFQKPLLHPSGGEVNLSDLSAPILRFCALAVKN